MAWILLTFIWLTVAVGVGLLVGAVIRRGNTQQDGARQAELRACMARHPAGHRATVIRARTEAS